MIKETLVSLTAAAAGAGLYLSGLLSPIVPIVTGGIGMLQGFVTTNPLTAPLVGLASSAVTAVAVWSRGLSKQKEMVASASQERSDLVDQAQSLLTVRDEKIATLETKVDGLTKQVTDTAQLKTQVTSLQTDLSVAQKEAQRVRDEYNALIRIKAVAESLPVPVEAVH